MPVDREDRMRQHNANGKAAMMALIQAGNDMVTMGLAFHNPGSTDTPDGMRMELRALRVQVVQAMLNMENLLRVTLR